MLTHLFRLIWNKKKQNFLLLLEIFFSFIGLFAGLTFLLYPYNNYKLPIGLQHENVWAVQYTAAGDAIRSMDSLQIFRESVKRVLLAIDGVEEVAYSSGNLPFSGNSSGTGVTYNGKETWSNVYSSEANYINLFGIQLLEGRLLLPEDKLSKDRVVVINQTLKKELFGDEEALGKIVGSDADARMKIVGVVADFKNDSDFEKPIGGLFRIMDTSELRYNSSMLVRVKEGAGIALEEKVYKSLSHAMKEATIEIEKISQMREARREAMLVPFVLVLGIAGFLIINVALGIFGVLWSNIHKRRVEIGLRRAVGASGAAISAQLVGEAVLLATLSLILGSFFALQFPLLQVLDIPAKHYMMAYGISILFIYVLVILCALYPGRQAAAIYPALALHEN